MHIITYNELKVLSCEKWNSLATRKWLHVFSMIMKVNILESKADTS